MSRLASYRKSYQKSLNKKFPKKTTKRKTSLKMVGQGKEGYFRCRQLKTTG